MKSRVSWPAIFAGTLVMLITLMLLSLLGVGIGLGAINPLEEAEPLRGLGTGTLIWWIVCNLIAIFAGAYITSQLTNYSYKLSGIYHGILTWSLYTLISFWIMTTAIGGIISGVGGVVSKSLSSMGQGISQLVSTTDQQDTDRVSKIIQSALDRDQELSIDTAGKKFDIDLAAVVQDVFIVNGEIQTEVERQEIEQSIARNSSLSQQDVQRATDVVVKEYERLKTQWQQVKQKAEVAAQKAADAASKAAIWSFVALLLGVITAAIGGSVGKPDDDVHYDRETL